MAIIYLARCFEGKGYVGYTKNTLNARIKSHFDLAQSNQKRGKKLCSFQIALLKHGKDSFNWSILEEFSNGPVLLQREKYWIEHYGTRTKWGNGYNDRDGGCAGGQFPKGHSTEHKKNLSNSLKETYRKRVETRSKEELSAISFKARYTERKRKDIYVKSEPISIKDILDTDENVEECYYHQELLKLMHDCLDELSETDRNVLIEWSLYTSKMLGKCHPKGSKHPVWLSISKKFVPEVSYKGAITRFLDAIQNLRLKLLEKDGWTFMTAVSYKGPWNEQGYIHNDEDTGF